MQAKESNENYTKTNIFEEELCILCEKFSAAISAQAWEELLDYLIPLRELIGSARNSDRTVSKTLLERDIIIQTLCLLKNQDTKLIKLQVEAAWLIANFSAGEPSDTTYLVQQGCIPVLALCLQISNDDLQQNAMWALANILGENDLSYRDEIIKLGIIKMVVRLMCGAPKSMSYTRTVIWLLSNALRGPPYLPFDETSIMLTVFSQTLHSRDSDTINYTLQGLYRMILTGDDTALRALNSYGIFPKIYRLFRLQEEKISITILEILNNMPEKEFDQLMENFDSTFNYALLGTINSNNKSIQLLGYNVLDRLFISEIEDYHLEIVHEIMPLILEQIDTYNDDLRKAAAFCVFKFVQTRSTAELQFIISQGVISVLCSLLKKEKNKDMILPCLKGLSALLCHGQKMTLLNGRNSSEILISQSGGVDILKSLQTFDDQTIRDLTEALLEKYFRDLTGK